MASAVHIPSLLWPYETHNSADGFRRLFDINVFGTINVTNAFLPYMRAAKSGTIVIIGSRHAWFTKNPVSCDFRSRDSRLLTMHSLYRASVSIVDTEQTPI